MAQPFPYTYYACDCYDAKAATISAKRSSQLTPAEDEDERTFDPRDPRSNYALYPLEHLLYCEDCRQIRCPRCVIEETLNWFCPNCLFEVPSSMIKSEGNRCTRNCYSCPICTATCNVINFDLPRDSSNEESSGHGGPFHLYCPYCRWSSLEIGIEFEKHTGLTQQLARMGNGGKPIPTPKEREKERERRKELESKRRDIPSDSEDAVSRKVDYEQSHDDLFASLSSFYKSQIQSQHPSSPFSPHDINFSSPSSFTRIMSLYSNTSTSKKSKREKPSLMREAASPLEGLTLHDPSTDLSAIERIKKEGWGITLSPSQKLHQPDPNIRFVEDVRPLATLLRTKRGKRCRNCRHILAKPESKITSTRYKIKLIAVNHIPRVTLRALQPNNQSTNPSLPYIPGMTLHMSTTAPQHFNYSALRSGIPTHFLLTITNPLFDPIKVTLATPSITPGKIESRITILCPQFDVGANTDVWDDALTGSALSPLKNKGGEQPAIEAGKVWDKGRNWSSIVVEVVPGYLKKVPGFEESKDGGGDGELEEDEDVLEIPVFVRVEYESEGEREEKGGEKREEAFWVVVGVGRIVDN